MNRTCTLALAVLTGAAAMYAQDNPFSAEAKQSYNQIKNTLTRAADKMPAENYSFKTVPEVRTYGEMITHIADVQFMLCGSANGEQ
jgi:hypothetical protein